MTKWYLAIAMALVWIKPALAQELSDEEEEREYEGVVIRESDQIEKRIRYSKKRNDEDGSPSSFSISAPDIGVENILNSEPIPEPEYEPFSAPNHSQLADQTNDKPQDVPDPPDPPDLPINGGISLLLIAMLGYAVKTGFTKR